MTLESGTCAANILGLIILIFLIYLIIRNDFIQKQKEKYFLCVTIMTILIILFEIIATMLDGTPGMTYRVAAYAVNILSFSMMFFLPVLFAMLYSENIAEHKVLCLLPAYTGTVICISSIWTGWIFYIDQAGVYHRGSLFYINTVITLCGVAVLLYSHMEAAKELEHSEKTYLAMLYLIILVVTLLQMLNAHMVIMWGGIAVVEVLYYIFLRELQFKYDVITKVYNRGCFEKNLMEMQKEKSLFLVVLDVNNLKKINDTYGHEEGDEYLYDTAQILQECYSKYGKVYRIGGDEFVVIAPECTEPKIRSARENMLEKIDIMRKTKYPDYYIANAYSQYNPSIHSSVQECLKEADNKMYEDKMKSKQIQV